MKKLLKKLIKLGNSSHNSINPLITISLSKYALLNNLNEFRKLAPNNQVAPVLKSNAYGHGINLIAQELEKENSPFFIIDSYFEAQALRSEGIKTPLLIVGYVRSENINNSKLKDIIYVISSIDSLKLIKSKTRIHLKIDTGMHRQGILPEEKIEAVNLIKNNPNIILEGICSHFADADNIDRTFTEKQITEWNNSVKYFKSEFPTLKYWHISASAGHAYKEVEANLTRLGIGLYGLINIQGLNLKPILEMKTIITGIKKLKAGESTGYGHTFTAEKDMSIALIPVGYYEGLDRRLSNKGFVKIKNTFCPIIGRVSMNITIIDISNIDSVKLEDEIIVMSNIKEDKNSIENIAKDCGTISYEIVVKIPGQLRRVLY
jgi:alanine racemase